MKKFLIIIGSILAFLVILNFALEPIAEHYANKALNNLKGYRGSIEDVDIHLWRGAYRIEELEILKKEEGKDQPFFATEAIDLSIQWDALFRGHIVGEVQFSSPRLNFIKRQGTDSVETGGDNDYAATLDSLMPIQINHLGIVNGSVHYIDNTASPPIDLRLYELNLDARNLSNLKTPQDSLPAELDLQAKTSGNGSLDVNAQLNLLNSPPDFDYNLELADVNLTYLNKFTEKYAAFNFEQGTFYISSEMAMYNGNYEGYVKPIMENIKIIDLDAENQGFWRKAWEVVVGAAVELFENQPKDRFATRVELNGSLENTNMSVGEALWNVLRNAFIEAFNKNIDQSVGIGEVGKKTKEEEEDEGFFEGLFGGDDDDGE